MESEIEAVTALIDTLIEFAVTYGFQIFGALVFLVIGLKVSGWAGRRVSQLALEKDTDETLAKFIGTGVKLVFVGVLIIITLGNFGISIAPLIALAGAAAFGATMALQAPLSNFGAGFAIILGRPFTVGDTITVKNTSGIVEEVKLGNTVLITEDGEHITVPNKHVVGEVIVNSRASRIVESRIGIALEADAEAAVALVRRALAATDSVAGEPTPQVGVHDFTYGGVIIGARFWVPSQKYFESRYNANSAILKALKGDGVALLPAASAAVTAAALSADDEAEEPGFM